MFSKEEKIAKNPKFCSQIGKERILVEASREFSAKFANFYQTLGEISVLLLWTATQGFQMAKDNGEVVAKKPEPI